MSDSTLPDLLPPRAVARRLGVHTQTLARWRLTGEGPPAVRLGGRWKYPAAGLRRWIEDRTRAAREEAPHDRAA